MFFNLFTIVLSYLGSSGLMEMEVSHLCQWLEVLVGLLWWVSLYHDPIEPYNTYYSGFSSILKIWWWMTLTQSRSYCSQDSKVMWQLTPTKCSQCSLKFPWFDNFCNVDLAIYKLEIHIKHEQGNDKWERIEVYLEPTIHRILMQLLFLLFIDVNFHVG